MKLEVSFLGWSKHVHVVAPLLHRNSDGQRAHFTLVNYLTEAANSQSSFEWADHQNTLKSRYFQSHIIDNATLPPASTRLTFDTISFLVKASWSVEAQYFHNIS